jgi:hypothetical protein
LASSSTSSAPEKPAGGGVTVLAPEVAALRYRGWRGGWIGPHRAFARVRMGKLDVAGGLLLMIGMPAIWVASIDQVALVWARIFTFWSKHLPLGTEVFMVPQTWSTWRPFSLPSINALAGAADARLWWMAATVCVLLVLLSLVISEEFMPWIYLLRAVALVQFSAQVYFAFAAARFPHDLATYTVGMEVFGIILIGLVPVMLGLTYYVFDFSFWKKLALTVTTMAYMVLFIPIQYLLHAYVLKFSVLFMPLMYFSLGPFLDVFLLICFYSWGMSWQRRALPPRKAQ